MFQGLSQPARPAERVVFYNRPGTAEQEHQVEAIRTPRVKSGPGLRSCRKFRNNVHSAPASSTLAYNLRTKDRPKEQLALHRSGGRAAASLTTAAGEIDHHWSQGRPPSAATSRSIAPRLRCRGCFFRRRILRLIAQVDFGQARLILRRRGGKIHFLSMRLQRKPRERCALLCEPIRSIGGLSAAPLGSW